MYDAYLAAIAKVLGREEADIQVIVSESGWPSAGVDSRECDNLQQQSQESRSEGDSKG